MSSYLAVRRWVDGLWGEWGTQVKVTLLPAIALLLLPPLTGLTSAFVWTACVALALAWVGFVLWRGWRVGKAGAIKADRYYDREGKFGLAPESHPTDSATVASRRRTRG